MLRRPWCAFSVREFSRAGGWRLLTGVSDPLAGPVTYVGLGYVEVPYAFAGQTGQLEARVWDVPLSGETLLVSRGTYRLDVASYDRATGTLRLPLFGNHWRDDGVHMRSRPAPWLAGNEALLSRYSFHVRAVTQRWIVWHGACALS